VKITCDDASSWSPSNARISTARLTLNKSRAEGELWDDHPAYTHITGLSDASRLVFHPGHDASFSYHLRSIFTHVLSSRQQAATSVCQCNVEIPCSVPTCRNAQSSVRLFTLLALDFYKAFGQTWNIYGESDSTCSAICHLWLTFSTDIDTIRSLRRIYGHFRQWNSRICSWNIVTVSDLQAVYQGNVLC